MQTKEKLHDPNMARRHCLLSSPYSQKHSRSSDVSSITIILYWHPWGCVGAQPQLMLSLTENQTSHKVAFLLPEIARCGSGIQNYLRKETCLPPSDYKVSYISVWSETNPGAGDCLLDGSLLCKGELQSYLCMTSALANRTWGNASNE